MYIYIYTHKDTDICTYIERLAKKRLCYRMHMGSLLALIRFQSLKHISNPLPPDFLLGQLNLLLK